MGRIAPQKNYEMMIKGFADVYKRQSYKLQTEYTVDSLVRRIYLYEDELKGGFIKRNINYTMQLRRIIKKLKPDIIVSFMAEPNFRALLALSLIHISPRGWKWR